MDLKFENSLDPSLTHLISKNWYQRPKSSSIYNGSSKGNAAGSKLQDRASRYNNTQASTASKITSPRRGILSGRDRNKNDPASANKDIISTRLGSLNSSGEQYVSFKSITRPSLIISPRANMKPHHETASLFQHQTTDSSTNKTRQNS